jgi:hypothetical protein
MEQFLISRQFLDCLRNFPHLSKPKVYYRIHNSPPLVSILSQISPIHALPTNLFNIHFNIVVPFTSKSSEWSLSLRFSHKKNPVRICPLPYAFQMPHPSQSASFYSFVWSLQPTDFISMNVLYRLASMMVTDCSLCGRNWNFVCKLDCQSSDVRRRDGYSPVSHREDPGSILGLSVWDWHWTCGTVAGVPVLRLPLSESFHQCSNISFYLNPYPANVENRVSS